MGRQSLLVDAFNTTTEAVKQRIGLSISAKTLPGMSRLQSPLFRDRERLRAERAEVAEVNAENPASPLHPPIQQSTHSPLHASASQDASNQPQNMFLEPKETFLQTEVQTPPSNSPLPQILTPTNDIAPSMDGQDPSANPELHQIPQLNNEVPVFIGGQEPLPNPDSHQMPQLNNEVLVPTGGQEPPLNPDSHQMPQLNNEVLVPIGGQELPPNPDSHQIPQLVNNEVLVPIGGQELPPNPDSHQIPQLVNNEITVPIGGQEPPLNPDSHQIPRLANNEITVPIGGQEPPPNLDSHQMPQLANDQTPPSANPATSGQDQPPNSQPYQPPQLTTNEGSLPMDRRDPPLNTQTFESTDSQPNANRGHDPQPDHTSLPPSFIFQVARQPEQSFQPPMNTTNPFSFKQPVSGPPDDRPREEGPSRGQVLHKRRRDSLPPGPSTKRVRARSLDPQSNLYPAPDLSTLSDIPATSNIPAHVVLRILQVRDQHAREDLLNDIRRLMAEAFPTSSLTGSTSTIPLSEDRILEIIRPLLMPQSTSGA
jgi:hypothetical protein